MQEHLQQVSNPFEVRIDTEDVAELDLFFKEIELANSKIPFTSISLNKLNNIFTSIYSFINSDPIQDELSRYIEDFYGENQ